MGHVPHVYRGGPWQAEELGLTRSQRDHLERVLRLKSGAPLSYTDGQGMIGLGSYDSGIVIRSEEVSQPRPTELIVASAPPTSRDRARFLVEKLAELGVARLQWFSTVNGSRRIPPPEKAMSWTISALEQSRGAWLMTVDEALVGWSDLESPVAAADPGGEAPDSPRPQTVVIGPEGGWAPGELPETTTRLDLGTTILRIETAAVVAAARLI